MGVITCVGRGEGRHTGRSYMFKDDMNLCIEDVDKGTYYLDDNEKIHGIFRHNPSGAHLHRKLTFYIDGVFDYEHIMSVNHSWAAIFTSWVGLKEAKSLQWILTDADTGYGLGTMHCKVIPYTEESEEPMPEPEPTEVDYNLIDNNTRLAVDEAKDSVINEVVKVGGLISKLEESVIDVGGDIKDQIEKVNSGIKDGFNKVSDKIGGLKIPSIDDIKDAFLSVCEELAKALWNRIIDEIEERYPDDKEESD